MCGGGEKNNFCILGPIGPNVNKLSKASLLTDNLVKGVLLKFIDCYLSDLEAII